MTVKRLYAVEREDRRLEHHRTEFAVTLRALQDFMPRPPAAVLDVGGGTGRYAVALTQRGYAVTLLERAPELLEQARLQAQQAGVTLISALEGTALDLSRFASGCFDVVLLMGPLYHLVSVEDRQRALGEAVRVLRPGGLLAASFVSRFAPFRNAALRNPLPFTAQPQRAEHLLQAGFDPQSSALPNAYYAHPTEISPLLASFGLRQRALVGCEGVVAGVEAEVNALHGSAWETWVDWNYRLGQDPALHGAADHLLYLGQKNQA